MGVNVSRGVRIIDRDHGYKDRLKKIAETGAHRVRVGVQGDEAADMHVSGAGGRSGFAGIVARAQGMSTGAIAAVHEFGATISRDIRIPERSWLRGWFDGNLDANRTTLKNLARRIVLGKLTEEQALELAGTKFKGDIQARIARGVPPPNAPSTIARKGSSVPLIDTGQLRAAVTYKVVALARFNVTRAVETGVLRGLGR